MKKSAVALLIVLFVFGKSCSSEQCLQRDDGKCSRISVWDGESTGHQNTILQELCRAGFSHKKSGDHKQFAVMNIHGDSSADIEWLSEQCPNVACQDEWKVDKIIPSNGTGNGGNGNGTYWWYSNGLPLWPLLNQCLGRPRRKLSHLFRRRSPKWPNYTFSTPLYHIEKVCNTTGRPDIAIHKLFKDSSNRTNFSKATKFMYFVWDFMKKFRDRHGKECRLPTRGLRGLENYEKWLKPLVDDSLPAMLKREKSRLKKCPDELFIYFNKKPDFVDNLSGNLASILERIRCSQMQVIIGFGNHD